MKKSNLVTLNLFMKAYFTFPIQLTQRLTVIETDSHRSCIVRFLCSGYTISLQRSGFRLFGLKVDSYDIFRFIFLKDFFMWPARSPLTYDLARAPRRLPAPALDHRVTSY